MTNKSRRMRMRRRQQMRRRLIICAGLFVLILVMMIGCSLRGMQKKSEAKETAAKTEQTDKKSITATTKKKETVDERVARVKQSSAVLGYPANVIDLLEKNTETVAFVEDYGKKKDEPCAKTIGDDLVAGTIPHLLQWDERWGYGPYGSSVIAVSGCGPTCLSMVVAGLTGDASITPSFMAEYSTANGYIDQDNNTLWRYMEEGAAKWNIQTKELPLVESQVQAELDAGHPIICSVSEGDFTQNGHFIVLTAYANGSVTVNDPFSEKNSKKQWVFSEIQDQIRAMWSYSL